MSANEEGMSRHRGYTLLEVLIASGIFVVLSVGLVALLNQGVSIWKTAELRGRVYERARAVLDTVADDLRAVTTEVSSRGNRFWVRFICDEDRAGRQRLRFVRSLAGEMQDPVARYGGEFLAREDSTHYDYQNDLGEVQNGLLLAPGGYQEVVYAMDPDPNEASLWRGVRSPIGGPGSLFFDRNVEPRTQKDSTAGTDGKPQEEHPLKRVAAPLAGDILYFGLRFWTPTTTTWDAAYPPLTTVASGKLSGPTDYWDSTRAILEEEGVPGQFVWKPRLGSLIEPDDDIFPEKVEVTVVIRGNPDFSPMELTRDLGQKDDLVYLNTTSGLSDMASFSYVRIGREWIRYDSVDGTALRIAEEGRGVRGTVPSKHALGSAVEVGTSFRRVVEILTHRFAIQEPPRGGARAWRRERE